MTLWLHIGFPKTGSSALQTFFARNADALREHGLSYPWPGPAKHGRPTSGNARWLAEHGPGFPDASEKGQALRQLLTRRRGVLLSSEELYRADTQVLREVKALVPDTRILVYLRDQAEMILSRYTQLLAEERLGPDKSLEVFAASREKIMPLRFGPALDRFAEVFGRDAMTVRSYRLSKDHLPASALAAFGISAEGFVLDNPVINKAPPLDEAHGELVAQIRARHRDGNAEVAAEWFPGQSPEVVFGP